MKSSNKLSNKSSFTATSIVIIIVTFIWFLAVLKCFLLSYRQDKPNDAIRIDSKLPLISKPTLRKYLTDTYISATTDRSLVQIGNNKNDLPFIPTLHDWLHLRSSEDYKRYVDIRNNNLIDNINTNVVLSSSSSSSSLSTSTLPSSALKWPPVLSDGSIPPSDGYDIMPYSGLKVPRFFLPEPSTDIFKLGSKVNDEETIFLMIASYRDFQCRETITSAYARADHPERLYIGAVDQVVPGDIGCLDIEIPCSQDPSQPICKYRSQISIFKVDASTSTGPVTARHIGDRLYRGQYYVMQMDAHCLFVRHWDSKIINQFKETKNEMAVLSSYLSDVQESIDQNYDSTRDTRPIMCNSDFEGQMPARYLRHGAQPEEEAVVQNMPQLQPYWAAGFSFSRGHFIIQVPYDAYQPMVFQGEEIAIGIRGFTYGYDFYAPRESVVFHEYASNSKRRNKVHMFWENEKFAGQGQKSLRRATSIIGMAPDIDPSTYDHREENRYGLGKVRELSLFYKIFLIDVHQRKAVQLCPFVRSGRMHRDFQRYLKPNGMGIDYEKLKNYNTRDVLPPPKKQQ